MIEKVEIPKKYWKIKSSNMRKVIMATLEKDLKKFKDMDVLEIGCGDWDFAKKIVERNNCRWKGLDIAPSKIANVKGTVDKIPFPDKAFDLVLCNQCMEHWYEYGVSFDSALKEINRVLRYKGIIMINSPVYYHGHPWFLFGKIWKIRDKLEEYFSMVSVREYYNKKSKGWRDARLPDSLFNKKDFSYQIFITGEKIWIDFCSAYKYRFRKTKVILRFIKEYLIR